MEPIIFWNNVRSLIKAKDLTQEWVCKQCGIPLGTIKNGMTNNRYPSLDNAYKIADYLNTSVEKLLTGQSKDVNSEVIKLLEQAIDKLS